MSQSAIAFSAHTAETGTPPDIAASLAAIIEAGRTITDLRTRLAAAERTIAVLEGEKRLALVERRAALRDMDQPLAEPDPAPRPSHLDGALASLIDGLGPSLVRTGP